MSQKTSNNVLLRLRGSLEVIFQLAIWVCHWFLPGFPAGIVNLWLINSAKKVTTGHLGLSVKLGVCSLLQLFSMGCIVTNFLFLPKSIFKKIQSILARFLWSGNYTGPCQFNVAWADCCLPKDEGGLELKDLMDWNTSAVVYQLWRIINKEKSIWVASSVLRGKAFWTMANPSKCSWSLQKNFNARSYALSHIQCKLGRNSSFYLWHDPWVLGRPLLHQFEENIMESSSLDLVNSVLIDDTSVLQTMSLLLSFDISVRQQVVFYGRVIEVRFDFQMWQTLRRRATPPWLGMIWNKYGVPKFSFLLWLVLKQRLLTRDRMLHFRMNVTPDCVMC